MDGLSKLSEEELNFLELLTKPGEPKTDDSDNPFGMLPKMHPDIKFAILFYLVMHPPTWDSYYEILDTHEFPVLSQYVLNIQTVPVNIRDNLALHAFNHDIDEFFKNISYSFYGSLDDINAFSVFDVNEDGGFIVIMLAAYTNDYHNHAFFPKWAVELFNTSVSHLDKVQPVLECFFQYAPKITRGILDKNIEILKKKFYTLAGRDQVENADGKLPRVEDEKSGQIDLGLLFGDEDHLRF
jgi:hypothetical protein